ncbi:lipid II flippase MurJ [Macrococcoides canis]|uniref:lipid II flippase MurJ n=1 Tax=Macrococcoides canis TaxID=1855823 RepID=UPI00105CF3E9|nr:lipid II flippase MurJ [Macrococcus canis]TDM34397.1 hypothetical protein ETI13_01035 [Macrococcus canis]
MRVFKSKVAVLILITLISNSLGLLREIILTSKYGTSSINDYIILAQIIPVMILGFTLFTFSNSFIPFYNKNKEIYNSSYIITICVYVVLSILSLSIIIYYPIISIIYNYFFNIEASITLINLTKIFLIVTIFLTLTSIPLSYLQIKEKFYIANISNMIIVNIIIILVLLSYNSVYSFSIGYALGTFISFLLIFFYSLKYDFKIVKIDNSGQELAFSFVHLSITIMTINIVNQIFNVIDRSLATQLIDGTVTAIYLSNRIVNLIIMIVVTPLITIIFPKLSSYFFNDDLKNAQNITKLMIKMILIISIPLSIFIFFNSEAIISIMFERGNFSNDDSRMTSTLLSCYSFSIVLWCLREVLSKIYISQYKNRSLLLNTIGLVILNIIIGIVFINEFGAVGIPFSSGLSLLISVSLLIPLLFKDNLNSYSSFVVLKKSFKDIIIFVFACLIISFLFNFTNYYFNFLFSIILNGILLLLFYIMLLKLNIFSFKNLIRSI